MNVDLSITGVTEYNKRIKLFKMAYALSDKLGLNADISAPWMEKARTHRYISREWKNDHWEYTYPDENNETEKLVNIANQCELITNIKPLHLNLRNASWKTTKELYKLRNKIINGYYHCPVLNNRKIADVNVRHGTHKGKIPRTPKDIINRSKFIPFIMPIITKTGRIHKVRKNPNGTYSYEVVGRVEFSVKNKLGIEEKKKYAVSVVLFDKGKIAGKNLLYISVFGINNKMIKSIGDVDGPANEIAVFDFPKTTTVPCDYSQASGLPNGLALQAHNINIPQISAMSIKKGMTGQITADFSCTKSFNSL